MLIYFTPETYISAEEMPECDKVDVKEEKWDKSIQVLFNKHEEKFLT